MAKLTVVLLADKSTHENRGRALHALLYSKQAKAAGMDVELIFDGGGAQWAVEFTKDPHFKDLYQKCVELGIISSVCQFCAKAFKVEDELKVLGANFVNEDNGHPNIGKRVADGNIVITL